MVRGEGPIRTGADLARALDDEDQQRRAAQFASAPFEFSEQCRTVAAATLRRIDEEVPLDEGEVVVAGDLEGSDRNGMLE